MEIEEIERKFLVKRLPEGWESAPRRRIEQAYISTDPVIRVRDSGGVYTLTCKGEGLLAREEFELSLTEQSYRRLLRKAEGYRVVKERALIPCGEYTAELDIFLPPFAPLIMAEVEFPSRTEAEAFAPPEWFGEEVTFDPLYTNAALSRRGRGTPTV